MPTDGSFASSLIVWSGSHRYVFPPDRDVIVGHDNGADIRVDGVVTPTRVVLHHSGDQWIAVDRGESGIYVGGIRMSTVFIRDGRRITLGDPERGPVLIFQFVAAPPRPSPPPPPRPAAFAPTPPPPPPPPVQHGRPPVLPPPPPVQHFRPPVPPPPPPQAPPRWSAPTQAQPIPSDPQPVRWAVPPAQVPPGSPPVPPAAPRERAAALRRLTGSARKLLPQKRKEQPADAPSKRGAALRRLTGSARKLVPQKTDDPPHEAAPATSPPQSDSPAPQPVTIDGPLEVRRVRFSVDGHQALADVSFTAEPGTLTSVIGLSEASTSALADVLGGAAQPSVGTVEFGGHEVAADYLRPRVAVVPRHDLLHPQLTVEHALRFAAELRFAPDTSAKRRNEVVRAVLDDMELNQFRNYQLKNLTVEQRKHASLAVELLTSPLLIVLDEPTAGLEPVAQQKLRATLRRLADGGRVVVVATTSPADLDGCDQMLVLTPTGIPVFAGAPGQINADLGTGDWTEMVARVSTDPYGAHDEYLARQHAAPVEETPLQAPADNAGNPDPPTYPNLWRQIVIAIRRQAWLLASDQRYLIFLTLLPLLFGAISLLVPGDAGLGPASPYSNSPDEAVAILTVLNIGAVVMGTALGIRDLFAERRIFRREQAHGLSASAFLIAKLVVYTVVAVVQNGIITITAAVGKGAPTHGAVVLGDATFELFVILTITSVVSATIALALSAFGSYTEQVLLTAVLIVFASLVFAGALFPVVGRFGLEQIAWFVPARWSFAALASTVDVPAVNLLAAEDDLWKHNAGQWWRDIGMLIALGALAAGGLRWRLRRPVHRSVAAAEINPTP